MTYQKMAAELNRMKAECYDWDDAAAKILKTTPTPADEAHALLMANGCPTGEDAALCQAIIKGTWEQAEV